MATKHHGSMEIGVSNNPVNIVVRGLRSDLRPSTNVIPCALVLDSKSSRASFPRRKHASHSMMHGMALEAEGIVECSLFQADKASRTSPLEPVEPALGCAIRSGFV